MDIPALGVGYRPKGAFCGYIPDEHVVPAVAEVLDQHEYDTSFFSDLDKLPAPLDGVGRGDFHQLYGLLDMEHKRCGQQYGIDGGEVHYFIERR
jgi:hypothetical protein